MRAQRMSERTAKQKLTTNTLRRLHHVYAHAHVFPKCFKSLHTLLGFVLCLCFVSSIYSCRCNRLLNFDLYPNSLYNSHCENMTFEVLSLQVGLLWGCVVVGLCCWLVVLLVGLC